MTRKNPPCRTTLSQLATVLPLSSGSGHLGSQQPISSSTPTFPGAARAPSGLSPPQEAAWGRQEAQSVCLSASGCSILSSWRCPGWTRQAGALVCGSRSWGWGRAPPSGTGLGRAAEPRPGVQHPRGWGTGRSGNRSATGAVSAPLAAAQHTHNKNKDNPSRRAADALPAGLHGGRRFLWYHEHGAAERVTDRVPNARTRCSIQAPVPGQRCRRRRGGGARAATEQAAT